MSFGKRSLNPCQHCKCWTAAAADPDLTGDGLTKERINNRDYYRLGVWWVMQSDAALGASHLPPLADDTVCHHISVWSQRPGIIIISL